MMMKALLVLDPEDEVVYFGILVFLSIALYNLDLLAALEKKIICVGFSFS